jgi:hypothetical protein
MEGKYTRTVYKTRPKGPSLSASVLIASDAGTAIGVSDPLNVTKFPRKFSDCILYEGHGQVSNNNS